MSELDVLQHQPESSAARRRGVHPARRRVLVLFVVLALAAAGGLLLLAHRLADNVTRLPDVFDEVQDRPVPPPAAEDGALNILLATTTRPTAAPTDDVTWIPGAQRIDTPMLMHIDADRTASTLIALPLRTWVDVPRAGMRTLETAFAPQSPSTAVETVERLTSVRIDHLAVIDWSAFYELIDSVGGIEITTPEAERSGSGITDDLYLTGDSARDYLLATEPAYGGLDRVARQLAVLRAVMPVVLHQEMRTHPKMLYDFLDTTTRALLVDDDWSTRDLLGLLWSMRDFRSADITFLTVPLSGQGTESGGPVVYVDAEEGRLLWQAVVSDEVTEWTAAHPSRVTPPGAS